MLIERHHFCWGGTDFNLLTSGRFNGACAQQWALLFCGLMFQTIEIGPQCSYFCIFLQASLVLLNFDENYPENIGRSKFACSSTFASLSGVRTSGVNVFIMLRLKKILCSRGNTKNCRGKYKKEEKA